MGGANSRASDEETVAAMIEKLSAGLETAGKGSTRNVLEFIMSFIKSMDDAVMKFVSECNNTILQDNWHVLNAYYGATQKARKAALHVKQHANLSMLELRRLQIAVDNANKKTERSCELAMKGLNDVDDTKIVLPDSLVTMLQEAQDAYGNVITICNTAVTKLEEKRAKLDNWIWKVVGFCGVLVLGVAISVLAPPIAGLVAEAGAEVGVYISSAAATTAVMGVGIAEAAIGAAIPLTMRIQELNKLATTISEQQALLKKAKMDTEHITGGIKSLKDRVIRLRIDLQKSAQDASMAKEYENMPYIADETFVASLEKHLQELKSLCDTCDKLCDKVDEAFEYFKSKQPGLISQRIRDGLSLDE